MTKEGWITYVDRIRQKGMLDSEVQISYNWNFGTTRAKRERTITGVLYFADETGIELHTGKRLSYKVIECVCHLWEAFEPDGVVPLRDGDGTLYYEKL